MVDVYQSDIKEAHLSASQLEQAYKKRLKEGDNFLYSGKNHEAFEAYVDAVFCGAPADIIDPRPESIAKQLVAKLHPTEEDKLLLYKLGTAGEELVHKHEHSSKNIWPAAAGAAAIALALLLGFTQVPTANMTITIGDNSIILGVFVLLAAAYFLWHKPKRE